MSSPSRTSLFDQNAVRFELDGARAPSCVPGKYMRRLKNSSRGATGKAANGSRIMTGQVRSARPGRCLHLDTRKLDSWKISRATIDHVAHMRVLVVSDSCKQPREVTKGGNCNGQPAGCASIGSGAEELVGGEYQSEHERAVTRPFPGRRANDTGHRDEDGIFPFSGGCKPAVQYHRPVQARHTSGRRRGAEWLVLQGTRC